MSSSIRLSGTPAMHRAYLAAHVAAVLFGLTGILGALIQSSAWGIAFGRAAFAVVATAGMATLLRLRLWSGITQRTVGAILLSGALLALHWVTFFWAVQVGGVAVATLGFASFPACIALLDWALFHERPGRLDATMLALVSAGLVLVVPAYEFGHTGTTGLLWGLLSGLAFGALTVVNRRGTGSLTALQVACGQNIVVAVLLAPLALPLTGLRVADWGYLAILGVACTGLSQFLFVRALGDLNARTVGLIIALEPVYAIAFAWALFGEQPGTRMLLGAALIVGATALSALPRPASTPS